MPGKRPDLASRVTSGLAGAAAAFAARKALHAGWKKATGREPPESPEDQHVSLGEAVAWALLLGALVGAARMIAVRYTVGRARAAGDAAPAGRGRAQPA